MTTLISPSGERVVVGPLRAFCREHDLDLRNLTKVINGERQHHKGWRNTIPPWGFTSKPYAIERWLKLD